MHRWCSIEAYTLQAPDQPGAAGFRWDHPRYRLAPLRDYEPVRVEVVEQGQAVRLELRCFDHLHVPRIQPVN